MNEETARAGIRVREAEKAHNIRTFSHGRGAKKKDPNCIQIRVLLWCRKRGSIRAAAWSGCGSQAPPEPDSLPHPSTPAIIIIKNKDRLKAVLVFGAGSGGRTRTVSPPRDFESCFAKRSWFALPPLRRTWRSWKKPGKTGFFEGKEGKMSVTPDEALFQDRRKNPRKSEAKWRPRSQNRPSGTIWNRRAICH